MEGQNGCLHKDQRVVKGHRQYSVYVVMFEKALIDLQKLEFDLNQIKWTVEAARMDALFGELLL